MSADLDALAAQAADVHVVVVGAGAAGLVAALELAKVGIRVTVLESAGEVGGVLRRAEVDGIVVDAGAESFATRGGTVRALIDDLGLGADVVPPAPAGAWVVGIPGGAAPLPGGGVLGIPDNPWAPEVRRVIGWRGAWRAYLDRLRPPLTIGHQQSLGSLVRGRMGARVLDRLVAPVTSGVYSARPDDIDVDLAAPGLNAALTRTGSLSGAVAQLRAGRTTAPGGAVQGIRGGMWRLADALVTRLRELGVDVRTGVAAEALTAASAGWTVTTSDSESPTLAADAVVVAVPEEAARRLLAPVVAGLDARTDAAPVVEVVTLVLEAPVLDAHPRGNGVLVVPGAQAAKALTHSTAKWPWLAEAAPDGVHVVRLSFGAQGEAPATAGLTDADAAALAVAEAAALLGVPVAQLRLRGARRDVYVQSQPAASIGRAARVREARAAVSRVPRVGAVGAWLAGTGLAQVVPDAAAEADRIRRALLFGAED